MAPAYLSHLSNFRGQPHYSFSKPHRSLVTGHGTSSSQYRYWLNRRPPEANDPTDRSHMRRQCCQYGIAPVLAGQHLPVTRPYPTGNCCRPWLTGANVRTNVVDHVLRTTRLPGRIRHPRSQDGNAIRLDRLSIQRIVVGRCCCRRRRSACHCCSVNPPHHGGCHPDGGGYHNHCYDTGHSSTTGCWVHLPYGSCDQDRNGVVTPSLTIFQSPPDFSSLNL